MTTPAQTLTLYYYEHCPYCVRVLTLLGMAKMTAEQVVLLNDDEAKPIEMIGTKMLPILKIGNDKFMPESLDIVRYLSEQYDFSLMTDKTLETAVTTFLTENRLLLHKLMMPRWVNLPYAEFATASARDYFIQKKTAVIGDFSLALQQTDSLSSQLSHQLNEVGALFNTLLEKPNSYAAIMLFSGLYGLLCVEEFTWPPSAEKFMRQMRENSGF